MTDIFVNYRLFVNIVQNYLYLRSDGKWRNIEC